MENPKENIDNLIIKLNVLDSRIQKLKSIAEEVLNEVNDKYQQEINELSLKKEEAEQKLLKIKELDKNE